MNSERAELVRTLLALLSISEAEAERMAERFILLSGEIAKVVETLRAAKGFERTNLLVTTLTLLATDLTDNPVEALGALELAKQFMLFPALRLLAKKAARREARGVE